MNKTIKILTNCFIFALCLLLLFASGTNEGTLAAENPPAEPHPMAIESLRNMKFQGGDLVMEKELKNGENYKQYVVSYRSEGLKIY